MPLPPPIALDQAFAASGGRWPRRVAIHLLTALLLCVVVASLITVMMGGPLSHNLVFSACIGGLIQALIESGRYGLSAWRLRQGRDSPQLRAGWPGWGLMAPWVLFSAITGHQLGHGLGSWLTGVRQPATLGLQHPALLTVLLMTVAIAAACTYYFYTRGQLAGLTAQAESARRLATENQLRLLQSQLEPHMLFNTLANLRVLIGLDADRAQAMLDRLIAFLRATLAASRSDSHPLAAEFDRLADYLALMQIRMGTRLVFELDLPPGLQQRPVPPLLLQPLVENCIKHGLEPKVAGGRISVQARQLDGQLLLTVRDTGVGLSVPSTPGPAPDPHSGFGTQQIQQRLSALYGPAARFDLLPAGDADGGTLARIALPDRPPAAFTAA